MCSIKKKVWNIWRKRVLHCTSELPPTTSQLLPTVTNHWALNTNFAHLFLNILKEIQKFKSHEVMTHPKAKFAFTGFCTEVNLNLPAHTKLDRKLFQGRAENLNITNRAFSHDVMSDILVSWNSEMAAMLVSQTNPVGDEPFSYEKTFFCSKISKAAGRVISHVSENALH